jgi:VIT1/CCC1 family predicted Fe2+/Mn2+ transporter
VLQLLEDHLSSRHVSRVVYGAIIGLALVVALQDHPPAPWAVIATLLGTAVAVGLAELYSELLGRETRTRRRVGRREVRAELAGVAAVAFGIAFPAVFFVLAAAGAFETHTAFVIARWTGLGLIAFYGFCAGRLSGASIGRSLIQAAAVAAIGGAVIAFKALIH